MKSWVESDGQNGTSLGFSLEKEKVTQKCRVCGRLYTYESGLFSGMEEEGFCSKKCKDETEKVNCEQCGKSIKKKSAIKYRERNFCGDGCRDKWIDVNEAFDCANCGKHVGGLSPSYKGKYVKEKHCSQSCADESDRKYVEKMQKKDKERADEILLTVTPSDEKDITKLIKKNIKGYKKLNGEFCQQSKNAYITLAARIVSDINKREGGSENNPTLLALKAQYQWDYFMMKIKDFYTKYSSLCVINENETVNEILKKLSILLMLYASSDNYGFQSRRELKDKVVSAVEMYKAKGGEIDNMMHKKIKKGNRFAFLQSPKGVGIISGICVAVVGVIFMILLIIPTVYQSKMEKEFNSETVGYSASDSNIVSIYKNENDYYSYVYVLYSNGVYKYLMMNKTYTDNVNSYIGRYEIKGNTISFKDYGIGYGMNTSYKYKIRFKSKDNMSLSEDGVLYSSEEYDPQDKNSNYYLEIK